MNPELNSPVRLQTVHEPADTSVWQIIIAADPGDLLVLARALQKVAVPVIELTAASYRRESTEALVMLEVRCTAARAQLSAAKLRHLTAARSVQVQAGT